MWGAVALGIVLGLQIALVQGYRLVGLAILAPDTRRLRRALGRASIATPDSLDLERGTCRRGECLGRRSESFEGSPI
jgi:hypothetical protein